VPRELEWLQRRHEGEPVAQIAARAGVTSLRVRAATDPFGPFPDPVQERHHEWVALRRAGVRVTEIARAAGISHQAVSKATADHGPFPQPVLPSEEQVAQWVARRREGVTITQLAEESGLTRFVISAATRAFGPFPRRARRMPDGVIALGGIATRLGVTKPTVTAWQRSGFLPDPYLGVGCARDRRVPRGRRRGFEDVEHVLSVLPCSTAVRELGPVSRSW
jgi:DNA-binding phage protein